MLQRVEHRIACALVAETLKIVEQRNAKDSLIAVLDEAQDGLENLLLFGLEIIEQVALY